MNKHRIAAVLAAVLSTAALAGGLSSCTPTSHAVVPSQLGVSRASSSLDAVVDEQGPITVETVVGAEWAVPRTGLINLSHPKAVEAKLTDGDEPIIVPFHAIRHPTRGLFLIDTGAERALRDDPDRAALSGVAAKVMHVDRMVIRTDTAAWIAKQKEPVAGVFLTHMHADHISGMRDVPAGTPVYTGPGEARARSLENLVVRPITDRALEGKGAILEWRFTPDPDGVFAGVLDVFGDGTFWALHVPGHTAGSTAFVARTPSGPVMFVGDACHTAWGWEHGVEPGTYSSNGPESAESLARLQRFAAKHPGLDVRLGHQTLAHGASAAR